LKKQNILVLTLLPFGYTAIILSNGRVLAIVPMKGRQYSHKGGRNE